MDDDSGAGIDGAERTSDQTSTNEGECESVHELHRPIILV
jgi:hypothetical protein